MEPAHRALIDSNLKNLVNIIDFSVIESKLLEDGIFTKIMIDDFKAVHDPKEQTMRMLKELPRRGPNAFRTFVNIMVQHGYSNVVHCLDSTAQMCTNGNRAANHTETEGNVNNIEMPYNGHTIINEIGRGQIRVIESSEPYRSGPGYYRMSSSPRGTCLIINNVEFVNEPPRNGSDADARGLDELFTQLHFQVIRRKNLNAMKMKDLINDFAKMNHSQADAAVLIFLSHGQEGVIFGTDMNPVDFNEDVQSLFTNERCPTLCGKPKLFFIQACRGKRIDIGYTESVVQDAIPSGNSRFATTEDQFFRNISIPYRSDILVAYSTIYGFVSNRNKELGSWYCRAIINVFAANAYNTSLLDLMTWVDADVQKMVGSKGERQVTSFKSEGFQKILFFNPGFIESATLPT